MTLSWNFGTDTRRSGRSGQSVVPIALIRLYWRGSGETCSRLDVGSGPLGEARRVGSGRPRCRYHPVPPRGSTLHCPKHPPPPSIWLAGPVARVCSLGLSRSRSVGDAPGRGSASAAGVEVCLLPTQLRQAATAPQPLALARGLGAGLGLTCIGRPTRP